MIALDLQTGTLLESADIDQILKTRHPYKAWLKKGVRYLESDLIDPRLAAEPMDRDDAGAVPEDVQRHAGGARRHHPRARARTRARRSARWATTRRCRCSRTSVRSLYDYFRQQFAQVTNPPIDPLRETIVMSLQTQIGPERNIFEPAPEHARQMVLSSPILSQRKLRQILAIEEVSARVHRPAVRPGGRAARRRSCACARRPRARCATASSCCCSRTATSSRASIPVHALLATGAVHQHLVKTGLRCKCNLLVETGTARDPHHFACLIGYGATAVYPYLAYQTLFDMMRKGRVKLDFAARLELGRSYRAGIRKGLFKIMSKMGISTIASYRSAQLFEIVGLADEVVELCFTGTESRMQGADFADLEADTAAARRSAPGTRASRSSRAACSSTCTAASTTCTTRT